MQKESLQQIENKWGQVPFDEWVERKCGQTWNRIMYDIDSEVIACANIIDRTQKQMFAMIESQNELNKQQSEIAVSVSTRLIEVEKFCVTAKNFDGLHAANALSNRIASLEKRETLMIVICILAVIVAGLK